MNETIQAFSAMMNTELEANEAKGDWCKIDAVSAQAELDRHVEKLRDAVRKGDHDRIAEHAADVGNCAMFVAHAHGVITKDYRQPAAWKYGLDY